MAANLNNRDPHRSNELPEGYWDHYKRLLVYVILKHRYLQDKVIDGSDIEGIAVEAILDTISGQRHFTSQDGRDLFRFLCGAVDSKIYHAKTRQKRLISLDSGQANENDNSPDAIVNETSLSSFSLGKLPDLPDQQAINNQIWDAVLRAVADDPVLTRIVKVMREEPEIRPREVADKLDMSIDEVQNAKKRLETRIHQLRKGLDI